MIRLLSLILLAAFALSSTTTSVTACDVECKEGEAYNDDEELCMPVGSFST